MLILPRQARDKHRENSKKRPFSYRLWTNRTHLIKREEDGTVGAVVQAEWKYWSRMYWGLEIFYCNVSWCALHSRCY
jgi:hypothetical protein